MISLQKLRNRLLGQLGRGASVEELAKLTERLTRMSREEIQAAWPEEVKLITK